MRVLVVTETDSCCGPMAAAFLCDYSSSIEAVSAGYYPSEAIEPMVVTVMKECLVDLSGHRPKHVLEFGEHGFDVVYECPDLPAPFTIEAFRELRDFIKNEAYLFFKRTTPNSKLQTLNSKL